MRPYVGVAIYVSMIGRAIDIQFTSADSEEEAERQIRELSCKELTEKGHDVKPAPIVLVKEVPQDLIDKYATPKPGHEIVRAVIPDEDRRFTNMPPPPDRTR